MRSHRQAQVTFRWSAWRAALRLAPVGLALLALAQGAFAEESQQMVSPGAPIRYAPSSPFNQRIPPGAEVDPRSGQMVRSLQEVFDTQGMVVAHRSWTVPIYFTDGSEQVYDVPLTADWAPARVLREVPIPDGARPDPEDDGHLAIVDLEDGCEYDFWQIKRTPAGWSASWGNAIPISSDGVFPKGLSARGSGFALAAGLIWPEELRRGRIEHALIFSYDHTGAGGPVAPATDSDGESVRPDAIPEGARIQLDPSLDLSALPLAPYERVIARALQEYGMILADNGGGIALYAVHEASFPAGAYAGLFPAGEYVPLEHIPIERLRVLKLPPQNPEPELDLVDMGCPVPE